MGCSNTYGETPVVLMVKSPEVFARFLSIRSREKPGKMLPQIATNNLFIVRRQENKPSKASLVILLLLEGGRPRADVDRLVLDHRRLVIPQPVAAKNFQARTKPENNVATIMIGRHNFFSGCNNPDGHFLDIFMHLKMIVFKCQTVLRVMLLAPSYLVEIQVCFT